ncbi:hypothetical protein SARC_11260 [Sphaeroforma arctica JP610]|uniref:phosphoglycerate mutase (2,3-diphosphoglycerate-dependent) n=1 Tax=Sphaeroforma arctica JP610 TaxID=667725 RepID=A0A0L0FHI0_9EUKA|nr:hypothetical protein SARC_11260 [Sphaeroforma arctica JP610]KNC76229.1 hypothetical protein SARC_11260 [Sphaeroforma arctica JP610]|eukprot:XP_014150131.1 hypothetical protein SARC_11260 [Sphaeroforma arctica JP610]
MHHSVLVLHACTSLYPKTTHVTHHNELHPSHLTSSSHSFQLTDSGMQDALKAGLLLKDISFACAFTSILYRAQVTLERALTSAGQLGIPVVCEAALNERDYGDLNGMDRAEAVKKFGQAKVQKWRRSYSGCPPGGESLKTTAQRTIPYLQQSILPVVMSGRNVIVSSHGNTIRAIVMYLMEYSTEQVLNMEIGWCEPLIINFNDDGEVVSLHCEPRPGHPSRSSFPTRETMVRNTTNGLRNDLPTYFPIQYPEHARRHTQQEVDSGNELRHANTVGTHSNIMNIVDEIIAESVGSTTRLHRSSTSSIH